MNGRDGEAREELGIGFQVWGQFVTWEHLMETGKLIDELGFDSLWSNDHLLPVGGAGDEPEELPQGPVWDGWMTLMGWSARTIRVTLGCLVSSVSYRSPALLVKMATALDHDSGGRAILGIGAGWHATEHAAFGFAYPSLKERLDRLEEAAVVCRALLDGGPAHLDGAWVRVAGAVNEPPPRRERLPLLIGGSGERRTLPIVARYADAWNGEGDPETFARKSRRLDELCEATGRDPRQVARTVGLPPPLIRETREDAVEALAGLLRGQGSDGDSAAEAASASPLVGSVDEVAARLRAYHEAGAQQVIFDWPTPTDRETLETLAGPVRDALRRSG